MTRAARQPEPAIWIAAGGAAIRIPFPPKKDGADEAA